ncbi:MAG: hypothetical protein KDJ77_13655 [Rhodobiaceae bacterium]|nr:hypothetical protein [Rhodobiaceae bacterium]
MAFGRFSQTFTLFDTGGTSVRMQQGRVLTDADWNEATGTAPAGEADRFFFLDPQGGGVQFGDGISGRVPPSGSSTGSAYRYGGGQAFDPPQTPATPPGVPIPYPNTGIGGDDKPASHSDGDAGHDPFGFSAFHWTESWHWDWG